MENEFLLKINTVDRFWSRVNTSTDVDVCWGWTAGTHTRGYGIVRHNGQSQCAHRVAWQLVFGLIPPGQRVIQACGNPACCNPAHLYLGAYPDKRKRARGAPQPAPSKPRALPSELRRENARLKERVSELEEVIRDLKRGR